MRRLSVLLALLAAFALAENNDEVDIGSVGETQGGLDAPQADILFDRDRFQRP